MIIDCHTHISAPPQLKSYQNWLIDSAGRKGKGEFAISDEDIVTAMNKVTTGPYSHLEGMDEAGITHALLSARPNQMMHSKKPNEIVQWYTEVSNDLVYRYTQLWPDKFTGVASLPQMAGEPLDAALEELQRCVSDLGYRSCILNPDPFENSAAEAPPLWDRYWHPLYELLCELDIPCQIHGTGKPSSREYFNHYYIHEESVAVLAFACSDILDNFPHLKVVASHGGGSIPYQIGRYLAGERAVEKRDFIKRLKRIYFDTVLHTPAAVEFLIKTVGVENVLYGSEWPGLGSVIDPETGRCMDNLVPDIMAMDWLSDNDKDCILWKNSVELFKLSSINELP